jgi:hypothetical protein
VTALTEDKVAGEQTPRMKVTPALEDEMLTEGDLCQAVLAALDTYSSAAGGRHDSMKNAAMRLVRLGEQGHAGVREALRTLEGRFTADTRGRDGGEFYRAVKGAISKVAGDPTAPDRKGCCGEQWDPTDLIQPAEEEEQVPSEETDQPTDEKNISSTTEASAAKKDEKKGEDAAPTQAAILVRIATKRYRLVNSDGRTYAVARNGPAVALPLRGRGGLREELAAAYAVNGKVPSSSALADALTVLDGRGRFAPEEPVHLRIAPHEAGVVLDLGTPDGRAVVVNQQGWSIVDRPPVLFRRTALTSPLPVPVSTADGLAGFRELFNVDDVGWDLLLGWLVAALLPEIPHPILALLGEQGTAKSTTATLAVQLVDPSPAPLRSAPREPRGWAVAASASWCVAVDNISSVPGWFSDALCKAVTGDGHIDRALYTDEDVSVLAFRRVVAMTSIDAGALAGDLAERLLPLELQRIPTKNRRTDAEVRRAWEAVRAGALGGVLDLAAAVLRELPTIELVEKPRMADFATVLAALDMIRGTSSLKNYISGADDVAETVIESDVFAAAVRNLAARQCEWTGTATELRDLLTPEKPPRDWPKSGRGASGVLKRVTPALRALGIEVGHDREPETGRRLITIRGGQKDG